VDRSNRVIVSLKQGYQFRIELPAGLDADVAHRLFLQTPVKVQTPGIELAGFGKYPGLGYEKTVSPNPCLLHVTDVLGVAVVVVTGQIGVLAIVNLAPLMAEVVPNRRAGSVSQRMPLDLVGGGGNTS
jgi:hypothetical protein